MVEDLAQPEIGDGEEIAAAALDHFRRRNQNQLLLPRTRLPLLHQAVEQRGGPAAAFIETGLDAGELRTGGGADQLLVADADDGDIAGNFAVCESGRIEDRGRFPVVVAEDSAGTRQTGKFPGQFVERERRPVEAGH